MNQKEALKQRRLKYHLDLLGLTSKNRAMAEEYLRSDPENRAVLHNAEHQSFRDKSPAWSSNCVGYLADLEQNGETELISRLTRIYWAVAEDTAIFALVNDEAKHRLMLDRQRRVEILGEEAEVAMEAAYFSAVGPDRTAALLLQSISGGEMQLNDFLSAEGDFSNIENALNLVIVHPFLIPEQAALALLQYRDYFGMDHFFLRCAAVLTYVFEGRGLHIIFRNSYDLDVPTMQTTLEGLLSLHFPLRVLMNSLGYLSDVLYIEKERKMIQDVLMLVIARCAGAEDLTDPAKNGTVFTKKIALELLAEQVGNPEQQDQAREILLSCADASSKLVRDQLLSIFLSHPEWEEDYIKLLKARKAAARMMGAELLRSLPGNYRRALNAALKKEKSATVVEALNRALDGNENGKTAAVADSPEALAERILKSCRRKKCHWLLEPPLPPLRWKNKPDEEAPEMIRDALLAAYGSLSRIGRSKLAEELASAVLEKDLQMLALDIFDRWMENRADSKQKWILSLAAVHGGEAAARLLTKAIHDLPQQGRGSIACDVVTALAISPDPGALMSVDAISRKFKYRQVKAAASAAMENAARELGISADELADRIVPDLGFDAEGTRIFDYGNRKFTVRLASDHSLEITNQQGKPFKNMPAPGKTDDPELSKASYEAFKQVKKQIRSTVAAQKNRLEAGLCTQRCWKKDAWMNLFVRNPIMHPFAISLIWGIYEADTLITTFRYMEDGSFNTVDEEEFTIPGGAMIGLVHPVEMDAQTIEQWRQQLEDYETDQAFEQLDRSVYQLPKENRKLMTLENFGGMMLNGLSLCGKLTGMGWLRGSVRDSGSYQEFYREDPYMGMGVQLNFSGAYIGDENDMVTVFDAIFYHSGTVGRGAYCYDQPKDEHIYTLEEVPERYFSEVMLQLHKATASSAERDPNWKLQKNQMQQNASENIF